MAMGKLLGMAIRTLVEIERAIRASWGADTCAPEDLPDWHFGNPARGQCGVTALVINDLLGGDLVRGEVHRDGKRIDFHWWNEIAQGFEIDLTREQFAANEIVGPGTVIKRPPAIRRLGDEYTTLRGRVFAMLAGDTHRPVADRGARMRPATPRNTNRDRVVHCSCEC